MKELLLKFFSNEDVNTGRQYEFDYVKALCIFVMVVMHTYIEFCPDLAQNPGSISYFVNVVLCTIFGASTFMVCMGIGFCYSKNKDNPDFFINRGIKTLILAYVLNIVRSIINIIVVDPALTGTFFSELFVIDLLNVDIMHFAGMAMITFGILLKLKLKPVSVCLIGLILSVISSFFPYFSTNNGVIDMLLGLVIPNKFLGGEEVYSCFPLISYFIYPAFGYLYGIFDRKNKNKKLFYSIATPVCGIIAITYAFIAANNNFYCLSDLGYYHPRTYDCIINILATIFLFGLFYFVSNFVPKIIEKFIVYTSSHINTVYCIHWVILYNLFSIIMIFNNYQMKYLDETLATIIGIGIYIAAVLITKFYSDYKNRKKLS